MSSLRLHRTFLFLMIGSLASAAAIGVVALLIDPEFSKTTVRIILTTLTVALFSLTALGCAIAWEKHRWRLAAGAGFVASAFSFIIFLPGIWWRIPWEWEEEYYKTMAHGATWSVLFALVCLLALARLKGGWIWTRYATQVSAALLATTISLVIAFEPSEDPYVRIMAIFGIMAGCGTICVPILHKLNVMRTTDPVLTPPRKLSLTCPCCELTQEISTGRSKCSQCGMVFNIELEDPVCHVCGYSLYMASSGRCPECGAAIVLQRGGGS